MGLTRQRILWVILRIFHQETIALSWKTSPHIFKNNYFFQKIKIWLKKCIKRQKNIFLMCVYGGFFGSRNPFMMFIFKKKCRQRALFYNFLLFSGKLKFFNHNSRSIQFFDSPFSPICIQRKTEQLSWSYRPEKITFNPLYWLKTTFRYKLIF